MLTKRKTESLSTLIKEADDVFSDYIRLSECDENGTGRCFICRSRVWWKGADCAHYEDRDNMATRYNEINCHLCCQYCNRYDPDHRGKYSVAMRDVYGNYTVDELEKQAKSMMKYMKHELKELIEEYKLIVKELKKQKHL